MPSGDDALPGRQSQINHRRGITLRLVAWFNEIPEHELAIKAGGKGASLCRMHRNGYPVPEGFIVCSDMFDIFLAGNSLKSRINEKLALIDCDDSDGLSNISQEIRDMIVSAPMPADLRGLLLEHYCLLGDRVPVAVRSSGTAEDLADASFAGQQETFLYVIGEDEVIQYVKECWASLYNDRAIFYRRCKHFDEDSISIAVVVQRMVNSEKAGVLFSANPITNDRSNVMIEAAWGLGEGVVQGIVTPDNYVIMKDTYAVTMECVSEKEVMVVRLCEKGGVKEAEVPEHLRLAPVLTQSERKALVDMAVKVESFYKAPQDLEWAIEDGRLYLLQSRPITTIKM